MEYAFAQLDIMFNRIVSKLHQVLLLERLKRIDLAAGKQGTNDFEGRILRCCPDKRDHALFHGSEQRVLLRLREAMNFVDEKYGVVLVEETTGACLLDNIAHILHPAGHRAESIEGNFQLAGDDAGKRSLPHSGRSPENKTADATAFQHLSEHSPRSHQVLLPDIIVQRQRTHSFC